MLRLTQKFRTRLSDFAFRTQGTVSVFGIYMFVATAMIGGLALDGMNISRSRAMMQVAADSAAHAAMQYSFTRDTADARARALAIGQAALPESEFNGALTLDDIEFGFWTEESGEFSLGSGTYSAARVTVRMADSRSNAMRTYLLRLVGQDSFDLSVTSVFVARIHPCFNQGFAARQRVDVRSENTFVNGFCIHSNDYVEFNNGNFFEEGVIVSMPDINDLWVPGSGFKNNPGLEQALRNATMDLSIVTRLPTIIEGLDDLGGLYAPDYLNSGTPVVLNPKKLKVSDFVPGRAHRLTCSKTGGKVTLPTNAVIENAVVISNCEIKFGRNILLRDAIIATTATGARSFNGSSGVSVGYDDACAPGGGAKLITLGGMQFPGKLQIYGGQLIAAGDISFAAQGNGVHGASFIAGGEISGTSNMVFGACDSGVDDPLGTPVARMVQ